jgi:alkanesulfonate monooxygenase SsuD/methylene tetrahydromethanopterin reductase-like flavin-dependent oxidoreductase (luciferase family)
VGWLEEEFDAIGVPFDERGPRADEAIEALRALWSTDESYAGRFYDFRQARSYPKPVNGTVPIVVGGHTKAAARRAGRLGDGFFPGRGDLPALFDECRKAAAEAGRNPDDIELTTGGFTVEDAKRLADLGVTRMVAPPPSFDPGDIRRALGEFSENLVAKIS